VLTFLQNVRRPVAIGINQKTMFCSIQPPFYPLSREPILSRFICVVDGQFVTVKEARQGGIRLLLFDVNNTVSFAQGFQFRTKTSVRDLNKVLVIPTADINFLFDTDVKTDNDFTDAVLDTVVNNMASGLIQIVSDFVISVSSKECLTFGCPFDFLQIFNRLQSGVLFVVPTVKRFKGFSIYQKRCPVGIDASRQIIESEVDSERSIRFGRDGGSLDRGDKLHLEKTGPIAWVNSDLFKGIGSDPVWERYPDFTVFFPKLVRHRNSKFAALDLDSRHNQDEITVFPKVVREFNLLLVATLFYGVYQAVETPKGSIDYFKGLLSYIGVQPLIVLVFLAVVIVGLVTKMFVLLKIILSDRVKPHVVEVFTQSAEFSQCVKLFCSESAYLILLSQVHSSFARTTVILAKLRQNVKPC